MRNLGSYEGNQGHDYAVNMALITGILACLSYGSATFLIIKSLKTDALAPRPQLLSFAMAGLVFHAAHLGLDLFSKQGIQLGVTTMASLFGLVLAASGTLIALYRQIESLLAPAYPSASVGVLISLLFNDPVTPTHQFESGVISHILLSIMAYCLITLALSQAILLGVQNRQLKHRHPVEVLGSLPPLQTMESMLFDLIAFGTVLLTLAIATGFLFVDDFFAQHLVHKTVFTLGAWAVLVLLLIGRKAWGWRGMIAVKWTLTGFMLLTLGYFGSKVVLEVILQRA